MRNNRDNQDTKRRSTFAILFYINRTKIRKDGTCQLLCKVSIDAEWEQIGTKASVNPDIWNPETGRADGRSENAVTVNRAIDELTREITNHYNHIKKSLGFVTAELVKNAVKGIGQKPVTLLALFREHNEEFKKRIGVDRIKETYDSYQRSYKHLAAFIQEKKGVEDITLRSLDKVFYDDFEIFLQTDCKMKPKTVHEHLYRLKKMTMRAVSQGTLRRDPYCRLHPELPKRKSRHLKLEDLKTLMSTQIDKPNLQRVRDWFIFSTFTGLAYADLKRLSVNDITQAEDGSWWIHIKRQKTDTPSVIKLLDVPLRIIEKYKHERQGDKVFNLYTREYLIRLTRELGEEYGFSLTFHKARHNFGTHMTLSLGVPLETVSKMMGHTNITTTQIYAQVTDKKVDEDMKRLKEVTAGQKINIYEEDLSNLPKRRRKAASV
ncbi:site-specific integrase [Barnesiella intestinihominis]|jgi:tyrosine type site-specific recombinase|uniref:site-specific integrase n=1 Tax=Barnesiellaceae TaxID=2005519 RepID=UPI002E9D9774|nr:site-specific integrase [Alistipes sp.]MBR6660650.1 site-specific integrase [Bacteroidales bacterium]MEE1143077.1 site-specific integrase [Bacteroidales bacterium]